MFETHHVVGLMTQFNQALGRRDGYRKHEPLRSRKCVARSAARFVAPVATPSSITIAVHPQTSARSRPPRYNWRRRSISANSDLQAAAKSASSMPACWITSSLSTTIEAPPSTTAPIASFGWKSDANLADQMRSRRRGKRGGYLGGHDHAAARQRHTTGCWPGVRVARLEAARPRARQRAKTGCRRAFIPLLIFLMLTATAASGRP